MLAREKRAYSCRIMGKKKNARKRRHILTIHCSRRRKFAGQTVTTSQCPAHFFFLDGSLGRWRSRQACTPCLCLSKLFAYSQLFRTLFRPSRKSDALMFVTVLREKNWHELSFNFLHQRPNKSWECM